MASHTVHGEIESKSDRADELAFPTKKYYGEEELLHESSNIERCQTNLMLI